MPILDPFKKALAQKHRLYVKICRDCGARNAATEPLKGRMDEIRIQNSNYFEF